MDFGSAFVLTGSTPINPEVDVEEIDGGDYSAGLRSTTSKNVGSKPQARGDNECFLDMIESVPAVHEANSDVMWERYVRSSKAFLVVFSVTDRHSYEEAISIYESCCRLRGNSFPAVLCANKGDMESKRQVSKTEALQWANSRNVPMFTTSAKAGIGIEEAVIKLVQITPRTGGVYTIAVLGGVGVGKTAIIVRFVLNRFIKVYDPTLEDGYRRYIVVPDLPPLPKTNHALLSNLEASRSSRISKVAKRASGFFSSLFQSNSGPSKAIL